MNIKNIILGLIIAVVFLFFAIFGTNLVYKAPQYEYYCNQSYPYAPIAKPLMDCPSSPLIEQKSQQCYNQKGNLEPIYSESGCQSDVNCNFCYRELEKANKDYSKNLFVISIILSLVVILVSALLLKVESVSSGLMFGSLMFLIYGTGRYFGYMDDWLRFIILGIALVILIYAGYWLANRGKDEKTSKNKRMRK